MMQMLWKTPKKLPASEKTIAHVSKTDWESSPTLENVVESSQSTGEVEPSLWLRRVRVSLMT
jgi:hypothetical protein